MLIDIADFIISFSFNYMLPKIGTIQFYLVFSLYVLIISKLLYWVFDWLNNYIVQKEYDEDTNIKKSQLEDRVKRQKEAEKILSKYFTVQSFSSPADDNQSNEENKEKIN